MFEIEIGQLLEIKIELLIGDLVKSKNGVRGFFVSYFIDFRVLVDNLLFLVFKVLELVLEIVVELLIKNLVMCLVMVVYYQ